MPTYNPDETYWLAQQFWEQFDDFSDDGESLVSKPSKEKRSADTFIASNFVSLDEFREEFPVLDAKSVDLEKLAISGLNFIKIYDLDEKSYLLKIEYEDKTCIVTDRNLVPKQSEKIRVSCFSKINEVVELGEFSTN